jgi:hypothetical protein
MKRYDPAVDPSPADWLEIDEDERTALIQQYHRRKHADVPNPRLHAIIHMVVENQIALGEAAVVDALARLRGEGLDRHEAIHAIGSVLVEKFHAALQGDPEQEDVGDSYREALRRLTAERWRAG